MNGERAQVDVAVAGTGPVAPTPQSLFPARDTVEAAIICSLCEILGVESMSYQDVPFDLGLDSMGALRLTGALRLAFGVDVTVADIYAAPTVADMAAAVRRGGWNRHSCLVRVASEAPERAPLGWVHDAGGDVAPIWQFAGVFGRDVYGTRAVGLECEAPMPETMEGMAAPLASALAATVGNRPVNLVGFSSGGVLAYEIARQIVDRGGSLGSLIMVDTAASPPADWLRSREEAAAFRLAWFWQRLQEPSYSGEVPAGMVERVEQLVREGGTDPDAVTRAMKKHGYFPEDLPTESLMRRVEAFALTNSAWRAYEPRALDVPILYLRSADADPGVEDQWRAFSGSTRFLVHDVGGRHNHLMYGNPRLQAAIRRHLDAQEGRS